MGEVDPDQLGCRTLLGQPSQKRTCTTTGVEKSPGKRGRNLSEGRPVRTRDVIRPSDIVVSGRLGILAMHGSSRQLGSLRARGLGSFGELWFRTEGSVVNETRKRGDCLGKIPLTNSDRPAYNKKVPKSTTSVTTSPELPRDCPKLAVGVRHSRVCFPRSSR